LASRTFHLALSAIVAVVAIGALVDVMEVDAAQYAGIASEMLRTGNWLEVYDRGRPYLDKPPLLFWLSASSYKVFGAAPWSYRLPSILFAFAGAFALYRYMRLFHPATLARTAVVVWGSSVAFVLMNNDVRCDTILTGAVMLALWQGAAYQRSGAWRHLLGAACAVGLGMLAKGPIALVAPSLAWGGHLLVQGRWRSTFDPRILVAAAVVLLLLLPMCWGLYQQHGTHGIRFFFWEQSFGRITGENRWKDDSTILFFLHEVPWLMLPWTLYLLHGTVMELRALLFRRPAPPVEGFTVMGMLLVFIALSLSSFKLPHYLHVITPLFSVVAARGLANAPPWLHRAHQVLLLLLVLAGMAFTLVVFPEGALLPALLIGMGALCALWWLKKAPAEARTIPATLLAVLPIFVMLNAHFYPRLLGYQANSQAGRWAAEHGLDEDTFFTLQRSGGALDFHAGFQVQWLSDAGEAAPRIAPGVVIFTDAGGMEELVRAGHAPGRVVLLHDHPVQLLSLPFLLPRSREDQLEKVFLLRY
jgi:4-amino-4-deoxy-L-arabinose transferase-like glycosyltransferase